MIVEHTDFFIGGQWVKAAGPDVLRVYNAATEEEIGRIPVATRADVDRAVAASRRAFSGEWGSCSGPERAAAIRRFADALERRKDELSRTVTAQNGMPINLSTGLEGDFALALLRYYAELAETKSEQESRPSPLGGSASVVRRIPLGVAAAIVPWNFPVFLSMTKIAAGLAAGCAMVVKASPETPLDSYIVAAAAEEAGFPAGTLNFVPAGAEMGAYLVSHPDVDKVAFTGSTASGRRVAEACAGLFRPVSLELGGKAAAIVLDDADLSVVRDQLVFASFASSGQNCTSCSRILAPASRYDEVVDMLAEMASKFTVGDPMSTDTEIGPMVSAEHRGRVESHIAAGVSDGAKLVTGGARPDHLDRGWFVEPTVFANVDNSSALAQQEIFGPVLAVIRHDGDADAIRLANESDYGLGGMVFSQDVERATAVGRQVVTGMIGINDFTLNLNAPFGGVKSSGLGREYGPEGLEQYQRLQTIYSV